MIFYTADTHFGDERIMRICHRPFATVAEMDEELIAKWNNKIADNDNIYLLGDVAIDDETACRILPLLRGKKHLLLGNHDAILSTSLKLFESVAQIKTIKDGIRSVCLCHYPLLSYENSIYGAFHIFGHIHNNQNDIASKIVNEIPNIYNAGVDMCNFAPMTLDELMEIKR